MSFDDIRREKGEILLECEELQRKIFSLQQEARYFSGELESFAKSMRPPDSNDSKGVLAIRPISLSGLERTRAALDYDKAYRIASDLNAAIEAFAEAHKKKCELGL
jgi:hypothetical protein